MKLPRIFTTKQRMVILLNRTKADFYTPTIKIKGSTLLGSLDLKSTETEFGEVISKDTLAKELADFLKSKQVVNPQVQLVLGDQIVFKGKTKAMVGLVPLRESQKILWQQMDGPKAYYVYNKDYPEAVKQGIEGVDGRVVGEYVLDVLTKADFVKELFFSKQAKSAKIA